MHITAYKTGRDGKEKVQAGLCSEGEIAGEKRVVFDRIAEPKDRDKEDAAQEVKAELPFMVNSEESILGDKPFVLSNGTIYKKRIRTVMTPAQSESLKKYFQVNNFPSTEMREAISNALGMKPRTVQIWFQNQRQKMKNLMLEEERTQRKRFEGAECIEGKEEGRSLNVLAQVAWCLLSKKLYN